MLIATAPLFAEKALTSVNENQNQKLNSPEVLTNLT